MRAIINRGKAEELACVTMSLVRVPVLRGMRALNYGGLQAEEMGLKEVEALAEKSNACSAKCPGVKETEEICRKPAQCDGIRDRLPL